MRVGKFILGLVCGLILGGTVYAQLGPSGPSIGREQLVYPGSVMPQPFLNLENGHVRSVVPLMPQQRNPC